MSESALPGKFLGIVSQDPSVSKSNRLHVDIFRVCIQSFEVYSIDSSKMIVILLKSPTSIGYFSNWTGSAVTSRRFFRSSEGQPSSLDIYDSVVSYGKPSN